MADTTKISAVQVVALFVISRLTTAFAYLPAVATPPANQDVWIVVLLGMVYAFVICGPLLFLSNRFQNMSLLAYLEKIMGKLPGRLLGLLLVVLMMFTSLTQLSLVDNFLKSAIIPETPDAVLMLFMLIVGIYAVYKGVEVLGRMAEIMAPFILGTILLFTLLNIKNMEFNTLLPVLADSTFMDLNIGAMGIAARFFEIVALAMLVPQIREEKKVTGIFACFIAIFTFCFLIITVSVQTVLGTELAAKTNFPYFYFTQTIRVYDIIDRIESINAVVWFFSVLMKFSLFLYLAAVGTAHIFDAKSYKVFVIPVALLEFLIALKSPLLKFDVLSFVLSYRVLPAVDLIGILIIPSLALVVYFFRRKSLWPER